MAQKGKKMLAPKLALMAPGLQSHHTCPMTVMPKKQEDTAHHTSPTWELGNLQPQVVASVMANECDSQKTDRNMLGSCLLPDFNSGVGSWFTHKKLRGTLCPQMTW